MENFQWKFVGELIVKFRVLFLEKLLGELLKIYLEEHLQKLYMFTGEF